MYWRHRWIILVCPKKEEKKKNSQISIVKQKPQNDGEKNTEEWAVDALKWNENRFRAVT